jgi:hypothetical protein
MEKPFKYKICSKPHQTTNCWGKGEKKLHKAMHIKHEEENEN